MFEIILATTFACELYFLYPGFFSSLYIKLFTASTEKPIKAVQKGLQSFVYFLSVSTAQYPELMEVVHAVTSDHMVKLYET